MSDPRSSIREVWVAQFASELSDLARRVEGLTPAIASAGDRLHGCAAELTSSIERHETAVATLSAQAMKSVGEFTVRRTNEAVAKSVEAQEALIQRTARRAFSVELVPSLRALNEVVSGAALQTKPSAWSTWLQHAATALLASTFTALAVLYLVRS